MQKAFEAEILAQNRDYQRASEIYQEIINKSDDPEIARRATQLAGLANNYKLMLENSEIWLKLADEKDKVTIRHVRISIFLSLKRTKPAIEETLEAIKNSKDKDKFALVYDTLKVFEDETIKEIFDVIYKKYENEYLAYFYYTQVLLNNEYFEDAIKVIKKAYKFKEFKKKESRWGIFLAEAYYELGEADQSIKTLKDYLGYSPKNIYLNNYYINILTKERRYDDALEHYRFMSANKLINFSDPSTAKKMALLNIEAGKFKDSMVFIDSIKEKDINSFNYLKGLVNSKKNNYKEAENFFKEVENDDPNYFDSVKEFSKIKIKKKEYILLKNFFKDQYKNLNGMSDLEIRLILIETEIFYNEKKFKHSMSRINSGLEKYKNHGAFLYTRAIVAEKLDRFDILEKDLKKLIELEPKNAQAYNALGYTWANNNIRLNEAHKYIDEALSLEPNDAAILDSKGWILFRLGSYKKAEPYFVRALKYSDDSEIVSHFVQVLIKLGKKKKAKRIFSKYIKLNPDDEKLNEIKSLLNEI
tara:strand:- start:96 stop:1685 length:1590 start_codon:yes stop_codon:yes gene_type:complete